MAVIHPLRMPKKSWLIFFSRKLTQRLQGETNVWGSLSTWRKAQCQKDVICYLIFSYFSLSKLFQLVHLVFSWTDQMDILVTFLLFFVPCLCLLSWFYFFFRFLFYFISVSFPSFSLSIFFLRLSHKSFHSFPMLHSFAFLWLISHPWSCLTHFVCPSWPPFTALVHLSLFPQPSSILVNFL